MKFFKKLINLFKQSDSAESVAPVEPVAATESPSATISPTPEESPVAVEPTCDSQPQSESTYQPPTLKEAFTAKYPAYGSILKMFESANLCEATWENLTKVRLQKFVDYMAERLAPNSVNQYAAKLKSVLNLYADEVLLPRGYTKVLTPKKVATTSVFLTESELQKLIDYEPKNDRERYVRNIFVTCAYCGMRHSDALRLNASNIVGDQLQYVSVKTKIQSIVPLNPTVREYILNRPDITVDDSTYNRIIRNICKKVGITDNVKVFKAGKECEGEKWEYVSSHTARRSCASNLYLKGLDLYTISRFLGHSSTDMTSRYICCGIRELPQEAKDYFGVE